MHSSYSFTGVFLFCAAGIIITACEQPPAGQPDAADLVLTNGRVYTVDAGRSWAEAVAISDGRITFVGSNTDVATQIGANTKTIDLDGRMLLPAFQDSHIHTSNSGMDALACNLEGLAGLPEYRATIAAYAAANPDTAWILGGNWSMSVFGPGATPSRFVIDELVPDRPVYLTSADGHSAWVNSKALEVAGITRDTPDPPDGIIDRNPETGELIGSLQEGAMELVSQHIPPASLHMRLAGLRFARDMLHSYGITSVQDAWITDGDLEALAALDKQGELKLRVVAAMWWERDRGLEQIETLVHLREQYDNGGNLRPITVKIMQDGVMENYTAAMLEPYLVPSGTRGIPMVDPEVLKRAVTKLDSMGFQVHFHAIGDAAVRQTLDAVEEAMIENGQLGNRHHVAHLQMIDPADIPRFEELDVIANFQPLWAYADDYVTELTIPFIGEERARWMYPIKSVAETGATVAFGSDWAVSTANPFPQIETAITRMDANDDSIPAFIPEERIDLATALAAFTINAAFLNTQEDRTGSIEAGKFADLIVLDQNLFEIEASDISETKVLLTLFEGDVVYGDPETL